MERRAADGHYRDRSYIALNARCQATIQWVAPIMFREGPSTSRQKW
jgi:hypothetical protein